MLLKPEQRVLRFKDENGKRDENIPMRDSVTGEDLLVVTDEGT
jgi:hypothetical protein